MFEIFPDKPLFGANLVASLCAADDRREKLDLGLGIYKNENGETTILQVVKDAEARLLQEQTSKAYIGLVGDQAYCRLLAELALGAQRDWDRISLAQTSGGVAALRICFDMIKDAHPAATAWVSDPTWANHTPIIQQAGLKVQTYPYFDWSTGQVDFEAMLACLETLPQGDAVLLQASCHNPSGADLTPEQWDRLAVLFKDRELMPVLDVAYQGFGEGLDEDVYGPRAFAGQVPEFLMGVTCSKNFSVYRDRAGLLVAQSSDADSARRTMLKAQDLINATLAMPPDHGAAVVRIILQDPELRQRWERELEGMRARVSRLRKQIAAAFRRETNSDAFDFIEHHKGMFTLLKVTEEQVVMLREKHAIYLVDTGRVNFAGLPESQVDRFVSAFLETRSACAADQKT